MEPLADVGPSLLDAEGQGYPSLMQITRSGRCASHQHWAVCPHPPTWYLSPGGVEDLFLMCEATVIVGEQVYKSALLHDWTERWKTFLVVRNVGQGKKVQGLRTY